LAHALGNVADYLAAATLIGVGAWMLLSDDEDAEQDKARRLSTAHGWTVMGLGIGIGLDELAMGFSLGLTGLSVTEVVIAMAVQAFIAVQLGLRLGARVGERVREGVERVAAVALILLGLGLAAAKAWKSLRPKGGCAARSPSHRRPRIAGEDQLFGPWASPFLPTPLYGKRLGTGGFRAGVVRRCGSAGRWRCRRWEGRCGDGPVTRGR
jgi:uncharacterized membrane protein YfcA